MVDEHSSDRRCALGRNQGWHIATRDRNRVELILSRDSAQKFPFLDNEGKSRTAIGRGGGGSNGREGTRQQRDSTNHTTPVAPRVTSPSQLRRGVFLEASEFRDRDELEWRLIEL